MPKGPQNVDCQGTNKKTQANTGTKSRSPIGMRDFAHIGLKLGKHVYIRAPSPDSLSHENSAENRSAARLVGELITRTKLRNRPCLTTKEEEEYFFEVSLDFIIILWGPRRGFTFKLPVFEKKS